MAKGFGPSTTPSSGAIGNQIRYTPPPVMGIGPSQSPQPPSGGGGGGGGYGGGYAGGGGGSGFLPNNYAAVQPQTGGGGGGGLGGALQGLLTQMGGTKQPPVTYTPGQFSTSVEQNPQLAALQGQFAQYQGQLAGNTDLEAQQAMQRERDLTSGQAKEFGSDLAARGIMGSGAGSQDLIKRVVEPGGLRATQANVALTNAGRDKQLAALQGQAGLANSQAAFQQAQQQFGLSAWQAAEQQKLAAAQLAAMQQGQGVQNLQSIIGLLGSIYSGF